MYTDNCKNNFSDGKKKEKALERVWKNRDFEAEVFWKRASCFGLFITLSYTSYFALLNPEKQSADLFLSFIAVVLSFIWFLAQKGSETWQKNWEVPVSICWRRILRNLSLLTCSSHDLS